VNDKVQHALDAAGIEYRVHKHSELDMPINNPADFARAIGYDAERITKTLLVRATNEKTFGLVVASIKTRLDLRKIANLLGCKRVQLANPDELKEVLNYPPKAVSPLGAHGLPVFIDDSLLKHPTILVGGGTIGVEIEVSPELLIHATNAVAAQILTESA
jgi:Cys-tRNA(Pro)/Cys-tRNA(Cys) deacylase